MNGLRTRLRPLDALAPADIAAWESLACDAPAGIPALLPGMVQAAARWLTPDDPPVVLTVERGGELLALTCLQRRAPDLFVPLPHWRAYRHPHAFQSGILHRTGEAHAVAEAIAGLMRRGSWRERAIRWHCVAADSDMWKAQGSGGLHPVHVRSAP